MMAMQAQVLVLAVQWLDPQNGGLAGNKQGALAVSSDKRKFKAKSSRNESQPFWFISTATRTSKATF
jgi:hypothetical protein